LSNGVSCQFSVNIVGGIVLMHGNWCNSWTSRRSFAAARCWQGDKGG